MHQFAYAKMATILTLNFLCATNATLFVKYVKDLQIVIAQNVNPIYQLYMMMTTYVVVIRMGIFIMNRRVCAINVIHYANNAQA